MLPQFKRNIETKSYKCHFSNTFNEMENKNKKKKQLAGKMSYLMRTTTIKHIDKNKNTHTQAQTNKQNIEKSKTKKRSGKKQTNLENTY